MLKIQREKQLFQHRNSDTAWLHRQLASMSRLLYDGLFLLREARSQPKMSQTSADPHFFAATLGFSASL